MPPRDLVAERVETLEPYVPGKTVDEIAEERGLDPDSVVKLSSNENPLGPPKSAVEAVRGLEDLHRYPSPPLVRRVEAAAAEHVGVESENVLITPGADGAIDYLTRLFLEEGDLAAAPAPTFQYYHPPSVFQGADFLAVETSPAEGHRVTGDVLEDLLEHHPKILFLCSPNNPTGVGVEDEILEEALDGDRIVVLDEAYAEFSPMSRADWVEEHDNLVVMRTLSKVFGLAGLRVGYAVTPRWIRKELSRVVTPLSVNAAGLAAAEAALRDRGHLEDTLETVEEGRRYLSEELPFPCYESEANFVAFDLSHHTAEEFVDFAADRGVILRDCSSFPGDTENLLRVTVGTEEENRRAVEAAEEFLEAQG